MRILTNAHIFTLNPQNPVVSALMIENGRILVTGDNDQITSLATSKNQIEDMHGRFILPAFCDAHIHLLEYGRFLSKVNCETQTLQECLDNVRQRVEITPADQWILGHGWNHNQWNEGYGSAQLLDAISSQHPIYLTAKSLHAGWANSAALRLAGISANSSDPHGGQIQRDAAGNPTGILFESAMRLVEEVIPELTLAENMETVKFAQTKLHQFGITALHDFDSWETFTALKALDENHQLSLRVVKGIPRVYYQEAIEQGLRSGQIFGNIQIGALKLFSDGALGPQTAAMLEAYHGSADACGMLLLEADEITKLGKMAVQNGISLAMHAIGDRANRVVLDAYQKMREFEKAHGFPPRRHRIEHVQLIQPEDQKRMAKLDIIASMQPIHASSDRDIADRYWGKRCLNAYAWNSLLKQGAALIFGSDAPVESPHPFLGLFAALTRKRVEDDPVLKGWYPEQCLNINQALRAYTTGPAYAAGMEGCMGMLAPNYFADLILIKENPFEIPLQEIAQLNPERTMMNGDWVW